MEPFRLVLTKIKHRDKILYSLLLILNSGQQLDKNLIVRYVSVNFGLSFKKLDHQTAQSLAVRNTESLKVSLSYHGCR